MWEQVRGSKTACSPLRSAIRAEGLRDQRSCLDSGIPARSGHLVWTTREIEAIHKAWAQISTPSVVFGDQCGGLSLP